MSIYVRKAATTGTIAAPYLFDKTAVATLPILTVSGSAGPIVSPPRTAPQLRKIEYIPHEEAMALYNQIEPEYAKYRRTQK